MIATDAETILHQAPTERFPTMSAGDPLAVSYEKQDDSKRAPVITLIGADLPDAYLDEAEPSQALDGVGRFFGKVGSLVKLGIVLVLVGGYPFAVVTSHKIDTNPVVLTQEMPWASRETGTMLTLLGRELTGAGWASDRSGWHPQARLTALPAWQDGLISALSDQASLMAGFAALNDEADQDLQAAARLLVPSSDGRATPRLNAAAEALQRYDGRLSRGLAKPIYGNDFLQAEITLYEDWFAGSSAALSASVGQAEGWPAGSSVIETISLTRARAHVASELLTTTLLGDPGLIDSRDASEARDEAMAALRRIADFNPVFISSQSGSNRFLSDHPATMAFYAESASVALAELNVALLAQSQIELDIAAVEAE